MDMEERVRQLRRMQESGLIGQEYYERRKQNLLDQLDGSSKRNPGASARDSFCFEPTPIWRQTRLPANHFLQLRRHRVHLVTQFGQQLV